MEVFRAGVSPVSRVTHAFQEVIAAVSSERERRYSLQEALGTAEVVRRYTPHPLTMEHPEAGVIRMQLLQLRPGPPTRACSWASTASPTMESCEQTGAVGLTFRRGAAYGDHHPPRGQASRGTPPQWCGDPGWPARAVAIGHVAMDHDDDLVGDGFDHLGVLLDEQHRSVGLTAGAPQHGQQVGDDRGSEPPCSSRRSAARVPGA